MGILYSPFNLKACYFPGVQNELADHLSRSLSSHHEWSLHPDVARDIFQQWETLQIDLFTNK